jgi:hypothetical protein
LEKICSSIDKAILETLCNKGLKAYGLCELVSKGDQQHPVTYDVKREQAQIHDRFEGIFYHRLLSIESAEDEDMSFGLDILDRTQARFRIFLAYKVHLGERFVIDFKNAIPKKIELDGYKFIHRSATVSTLSDHETIYNQEYGATSYERHRTPWNIYAFEYNLEFVEC